MSYRRLRPWGGGAVRVRVFALFVLIFLAISAFPAFSAETINLADYVNPEYGHKDTATDVKYYKFDTSSENIVLVDGSAENHDFAYYVDGSRLGNIPVDYSSGYIDKDFVDIEHDNIHGIAYLAGDNQYSITGDLVNISAKVPADKNAYAAGFFIQGPASADFKGVVIGNEIISEDRTSCGILVWNESDKISNVQGVFIGNRSVGVSSNASCLSGQNFGYIIGNFVANISEGLHNSLAGAIRIYSAEYIEGAFINNGSVSAGSATGGALSITDQVGSLNADFITNYAVGGDVAKAGALYVSSNEAVMKNVSGTFSGNYVNASSNQAQGGAIWTAGKISIKNSNFFNNHADGAKSALGGAIYTENDLEIAADNCVSAFIGNYIESAGQKTENAIFVVTSENSSPTITLNATNNGTITFNDQIDGGTTSGSTVNRDYAYNLTLTGDKSSKIVLNNDIINANIQIEDTNVFLNNAANFAQSKSLDLVSGVLNIQNFGGQTINFESFSNDGVINIATVGVNLADGTMGHIVADNYGSHNGTINIQNLNIQGNSKQGSLSIRFADSEFSENVVYSGAPRHYTPVYIYDIAYNSANGNFNFLQSYNPAVLTSAVAQQAGAYVSQLHTYNLAFEHLDYYMNFSKKERIAMKNRKKYAFSGVDDARTSGVFSPLFTKNDDEAFWVKPYSSFESIPLSGGVKVSNISYGTLIGHDSELKSLKNGWQSVITTYIGYNGASQRYSGIDSWQNGGTIGATATFYKNNFFNATTINAGASSGDARTMYGAENYNMLTAGIANKTGYNMEFFEGKFIVQPSVLLSYTFVNTFDFRNAAGLKINSDPLNAIQVAPGVKLIGNTKSGWQPYLSFTMAWNLIDQTRVKANDVWLPSLSIDPYVLYGAGVQKRWSENFTVYAQVMIYNGGRRGALLNFGLRWAIGKNK